MSRDVPAIVSVEMGYGHLRAALPLADALGIPLLHADQSPISDAAEQRSWRWVQRGHERLSKPSYFRPVLGKPTQWMDKITNIPPLYGARNLERPNVGAKLLDAMIARGLGRGLVRYLVDTGSPLITTFYAPAVIANRAGFDRVYCVVTDADINRVWVPRAPQTSRVHYFAPSTRVVRRLRAYGVPETQITLTGFPLPPELADAPHFVQLRRSVAKRLTRLDPERAFRALHGHDVERSLGGLPNSESAQPPHLVFAVGGAGAQADMAFDFLPSLRPAIEEGRLSVTLTAGTRSDVARTFEAAIASAGLAGRIGRGVSILHESSFRPYYDRFNRTLASADILWTKPSELSFYAALGLAVVLSTPVGSHERYNRRWLREQGVALKQHTPKHALEWLEEWLKDGTLAAAAWMGFVRLPKEGTRRIVQAVTGRDPPSHGDQADRFSPYPKEVTTLERP